MLTGKVNDKMLSFTYERRFADHPDYPQLWSIRETIRKMRQNRKRRSDDGYHQKLDRLKSRATELEIRINAQLFGEARVIASTLTGSASRLLMGQKFGTLFIDEAAQALEAACWIAIRRASRVILAGDHCQLPPTVKSIAALRGGLGVTLMERIVRRKPDVVTLLKTQYRMNETIMRFSSDWFYGGMVEAAAQIKYRGILDLDNPMMWIDTAEVEGKEEFVGESFGRINRAEAQLTLDTLQEYFTKIGKQRRAHRRRHHIALPRPGAAFAAYGAQGRVLQALPQPHIGEHGGRFSGTGARHHRNLPCPGERRRTDRFPVRPAPHERGYYPGTHETHNTRRRGYNDTPPVLQETV